jgi:hypothetical protein
MNFILFSSLGTVLTETLLTGAQDITVRLMLLAAGSLNHLSSVELRVIALWKMVMPVQWKESMYLLICKIWWFLSLKTVN